MSGSETGPPQLVDRKGRLWQERTVIVRRESDGFGFTLSQQMPVFVDKVFPGSSAEKAKVLVGDRILKVNGMSVMGHKHSEVVDMIRDSSFVTLTLIGKLGSNGTAKVQRSDSAHNLEISAPGPLQELTLQSLKMMLQKQRKSYETLSVEYGKQPSEKLEKELKDCESIIKILESEIASKSPAIEAHRQTTSANIEALTGRPHQRVSILDDRMLTKKLLGGSLRDYDDSDGGMHSSSTSARKQSSALSSTSTKNIGVPGNASPKPSRSHTFSFSNGTLSPLKQWKLGKRAGGDVSDGSDEDLSDEVDGASEAGPFSSLQELKGFPAHMSVFLHYLYLSKEPKYLLFYLVANSYQSHCKTVEMLKQRGKDICWTFIMDHTPLKLKLDEAVRQRILNTLENEESESKLRSVFVEVRESLSETIITDLANYRHKRIMGLAGMFGDHLLSPQMNYAKQCDVMISTLSQDLKQCLDEKSANNVDEAIKNQAIAACLATFMLDVLNTGSRTGIKPPSVLEKVQSFTNQQKKAKTKRRPSTITKNGHTFQLTSYKCRTACDLCGKVLWGVVHHGYQCSLCEINIHRYHCISEVMAECAGQGGKRTRLRKSSQHKKINLSVTLEETDNNDPFSSTKRDDEDECFPSDPVSPPVHSQEQDTEPPAYTSVVKDRSMTDPKLPSHSLLSQSASVGDHERHPANEQSYRKENLSRTQSERLNKKPDSVHKQLSNSGEQLLPASLTLATSSVHPSSSFSDESQLYMSGLTKSASIDESGGQRLPIVEENIKELEDDEIETERIPWALKAKRELLQGMNRYEIERQENIRELVYTERTHLQKLKIMKYMYKIRLQKQNILSAQQAEQLFPSLEELILFHNGLCADLKERVNPVQNEICKNIADVLLQRFDGAAGERLCHACSAFAANQAKGDKLLKEWKRKNERFRAFIKVVEMEPLCQRLSLTELMPIAWQRLTKYKMLINNILKSYKREWDNLDEEEKREGTMIENALSCVKNILQYVNKQVRRAENRQRLAEVQAKMDCSAMEKSTHPIAKLFKNLDLTAENRRLIHEGPLTWRIQTRKAVELYALLLNDVLVLLERHDEKFHLRCHTSETMSGNKLEYSPVIRLQECLLRHAAHDRGNRTFLVVNNSNLMKLAQMYEFIAEGPQEKKHWEEAIKRAMIGTEDSLSPELPSSPVGNDFSGGRLPLGLSSLTSHLNTREQLDKIDDDMKKLLMDKLNILRAMQGGVGGHRSTDSTPKHVAAKDLNTPKAIVGAAIEQAGEIYSTVAHIMVPNPTKRIIEQTQTRLTDIIRELEKNLSRLVILVGGEQGLTASVESFPSLDLDLVSAEHDSSDKASSTPTGDELPEDGSLTPVKKELEDLLRDEGEEIETRGRESSVTDDMINIPSPIPEVDELIHSDAEDKTSNHPNDSDILEVLPAARSLTSYDETSSGDESLTVVVAPPDTFLGDDSSTPTPMLDNESLDSGKSTPRFLESPSTDSLAGKSSPLVVAQYRSSDDHIHRTGRGSPDSSVDQTTEIDSRQPLSPLAKSSYSSGRSSAEHMIPGSQTKGLSIYPSPDHDSQPLDTDSDEDQIVSYTLSNEESTDNCSKESQGTGEVINLKEEHISEHYIWRN